MHTVLYPINTLKIGGAEQQLLELVRGLDKTRFHPIVAPLYPGGALDAEFRAIEHVTVVDLNRRGKYDPSPLWNIARLLRRYQVDIIQPFLSPATFFGLVPTLGFSSSRVVVTERCGVRRVRGLGYRAYRHVEDRLSFFADAIVPNSLAGREMLLERGLKPKKILVIYNGINPERLEADPAQLEHHREQLNLGRGSTVVGIVASLSAAKGHDTLLRAIDIVRRQHPGVHLAIVGDGPHRATLEALTEELDLRSHATFFGYQRRVADFLGLMDILVSASRDNEGCSNSILEAMAVGVPVVATDTGGNQELVRDGQTGLLTPPDDPQALADRIVRGIQAPHELQAMASRAKAMVESDFSLQRMVSDYERLYVSLLHQPAFSIADADGQPVLLQERPMTADHGSN